MTEPAYTLVCDDDVQGIRIIRPDGSTLFTVDPTSLTAAQEIVQNLNARLRPDENPTPASAVFRTTDL